MYRCAICKKAINIDVKLVGLQCDNCGSKIFYKMRPSIKRNLKAV